MSRHVKLEDTSKVKVKRLKPIKKAFIQNTALPAVNTAWLSSSIKPKHTPCGIRMTVGVSTPGNLSVVITHSGYTAQTLALNQGQPLAQGSIYVFEFMLHHGDRLNFQYSTTGGTIQILRVEEIDASVAVGNVSTT